MEVSNPTIVAKLRLTKERRSSEKSLIPAPYPIPMIGPISGDMSIAPMMTAVELTLRPIEATKIANIKIHRVAPRISTSLRIRSSITSSSAIS